MPATATTSDGRATCSSLSKRSRSLPSRRHAWWLFPAGLALLAAVGVYATWSPVPFMDDWDASLSFVMDVQDGDPSAWWRQHNEHRIVLTRVLLYPVMTALGGRTWLLSTVSLVSVACGAWLLSAIVSQGVANRAQLRAWTPWLAVVAGMMWSWSQHETLEWGLNVTFVLALLAPTAALWLQGRGAAHRRPTTRTEHALAATLGALAAGTVAAGLAVLPLLAVRAWWTRASRRAVAGYALLGALVTAAYLNGYVSPPSSGSPLVAVVTSPLSFGAFVSLFLGGSVRWLLGESRPAAIAGGLAGIVYVWLLVRAAWQLRQRQPDQAAAVSLWCLAAYVMLMALLIAAGRTQVFGIFSALASRYNTIALWGWAALGLLALRLGWLTPHEWSTRRRLVLAALCVLVFVRQASAVQHSFEPQLERPRAGLALALQVDDVEAIRLIYPVPARAIAIARRSEQHRIGFLAHAPYAGLRDRVGAALPVTARSSCQATLEVGQPLGPPGSMQRLTGRLHTATVPDATQAVAVVDAGVIVGFMVTGRATTSAAPSDDDAAGVVGYATLSSSSRPVLAWNAEACAATVEVRD